MSKDDSDEEKPKGFDISKLDVEMNDDERAAMDERLKEQLKELADGKAVMARALQGIGGLTAVEKAMQSANSLQDAINASGLGRVQDHIDAITGKGFVAEMFLAEDRMRDLLPDIQAHTSALAALPDYAAHTSAIQSAIDAITELPEPWGDVYGLTAATRLAEEMRRQQALYFEPVSFFADIQGGAIADIRQSVQAMVLPRLDIMDSLGIGRMADAFGAANVYQSLGLGSDYDTQMRVITSSLNGHIEALASAQAARDAMFPSSLTDAIESLLARSLAAQEAMLAEYRESASDAKTEARFNRRMVTLATIINVLMFFMTVVLNIEDRLADEDAVARENTEAVLQMRQSFDEMSRQVQRMNEMQEAATEQDRAADAAIADLLREIANSLIDQAGSGGHDASKHPLAD